MNKHTPGPWFIWKERAMQDEGMGADEIDEELSHYSDFDIYSGSPVEITRGLIKGGGPKICDLDADFLDEGQDVLANARLIAAAPDLLEALQSLVSAAESIGGMHVEGWVHLDRMVAEAHAAIAKATRM